MHEMKACSGIFSRLSLLTFRRVVLLSTIVEDSKQNWLNNIDWSAVDRVQSTIDKW